MSDIIDNTTTGKIPTYLKKTSNILTEAESAVYSDREKTYGEPAQNLGAIAVLWSSYLKAKFSIDVTLTAEDVAWLMIQLKTARAMRGFHRDDLIDTAGYAALIERIRPCVDTVITDTLGQGLINPIPASALRNIDASQVATPENSTEI